MSTEVRRAIIEHLKLENRPMHRDLLVAELVRFGKYTPASYPAATVQAYGEALDKLIEDGLVISAGGRVGIDRDKAFGQDQSGMLF